MWQEELLNIAREFKQVELHQFMSLDKLDQYLSDKAKQIEEIVQQNR